MNHLFILILFTLSGPLLGCWGQSFYYINNQSQKKEPVISLINFFEKEIIIKNSKDPHVYCNILNDTFKNHDIDTKHYLTDKTVFEELYLCDSRAVSFGLFIKKAQFTQGMAKNICTKIDSKFYLISDVTPKSFTYVKGGIIRINGKNFCKAAFDTQMDEIELTKCITNEDIKSYFKDFVNPLGHQEVFSEVFHNSKQKIETLILCFKKLNIQKKIKIPKDLIHNYFIPAILNERFEGKFKEVNTIFIDAILDHNKEQEMAYIKTPIHDTIQQFFLSGESIKSFDENSRTAFINFLNQNK